MAEQSSNGNGRWKVDPMVALHLIGWLVFSLLTYGAVDSRVAVVESRQSDSERRLERIENKVDKLLDLAR